MRIAAVRKTGKSLPTWDIEVKNHHAYQLKNGVLSHNTISNICDSTACTELPYDNTYERANASGTYIMISHTLRIAQKLGVEHLAKTSKQVDQLWNIKAACVRQQWIDQAQSTNIFVKDTNSGDYLTQLYMTGWYYGLPTFYYLHSESAKEKIIKVETPDNTIAESEDAEAEVCMLGEACTSCQ